MKTGIGLLLAAWMLAFAAQVHATGDGCTPDANVFCVLNTADCGLDAQLTIEVVGSGRYGFVDGCCGHPISR